MTRWAGSILEQSEVCFGVSGIEKRMVSGCFQTHPNSSDKAAPGSAAVSIWENCLQMLHFV